jgi:hypothetical protein
MLKTEGPVRTAMIGERMGRSGGLSSFWKVVLGIQLPYHALPQVFCSEPPELNTRAGAVFYLPV